MRNGVELPIAARRRPPDAALPTPMKETSEGASPGFRQHEIHQHVGGRAGRVTPIFMPLGRRAVELHAFPSRRRRSPESGRGRWSRECPGPWPACGSYARKAGDDVDGAADQRLQALCAAREVLDLDVEALFLK